MFTPGIKPSRWWYGVPFLVFVLGLIVAVWSMFSSMTGFARGMQRVVAPGTETITLQEPGTYTIYYESRSTVDGRIYAGPPDLAGLQVEIKPAAGGEAIPVRAPSGSSNYSMGEYAGVSILTFTVQEPGSYTITSQLSGGRQAVLAVTSGSLLAGIGTFLIMIPGTMLLSVGSGLAVFFLRRKAKRALQ